MDPSHVTVVVFAGSALLSGCGTTVASTGTDAADVTADAQDATADVTDDAPLRSDATDACAPPACDLTGTWTWHVHPTRCASDPTDRALTVMAAGGALTVDVAADGIHATGTVCGRALQFDVRYDRAVPAALRYSGTVDATCRHISGDFGGECVTGTWSAERP